MSTQAPPKRFKPEPIETSVKSSRKFAPEPVETTTRTSRKLAPEPVETTSRSSRKFAPEPVETSVKSSRNKPSAEMGGKTRAKFTPQPVETTIRSNRKKQENGQEAIPARQTKQEDPSLPSQNANSSASSQDSASAQPNKRPRRRFAPQLIETATRSRRSGDASPTLLPSDSTEAIQNHSPSRSPRRNGVRSPPSVPINTPMSSSQYIPQLHELRRVGSPLSVVRQDSRGSNRSHSFRVPDLEPIESSQSEESNPPSPTTSISSVDRAYPYKHATRMRESVDERVKGYLLELAAKAAEKQLREQAMAAFPNDDYHEPVDHFIDHEDEESVVTDETSSPMLLPHERANRMSQREPSFTKVNWELRAMQEYTERLERQKDRERGRQEPEKSFRRSSARGPWGDASAALFGGAPNAARNIDGAAQKDGELDQMRNGARPPMLGADIEFPRCRSPEPERFDVTQGSDAIRSSMCYLMEQSQMEEDGGLWHGKKRNSSRPSLWAGPSRQPSNHGGLWNGYCQQGTGTTPPRAPSGLMTPRIEMSNPFETPPSTPTRAELPPSPPNSWTDFTSIDEKLATELTIEEEFSDTFVTQVYNYLSLGYPSIARNFDAELSKISHITISELRQDDHLAQSKGYIRLGEDEDMINKGITEEMCMRWKALRSYIHEWARQQPRMGAGPNAPGGVGIAVRRGSWAL